MFKYDKRKDDLFGYEGERVLVHLTDNKCSMERGIGPRIKERYKEHAQSLLPNGWNGHSFCAYILNSLLFMICCGYQKPITKTRLIEGFKYIKNTFPPCKLIFSEKDFEDFDWDDVYNIIFYVFGETDFDILIVEEEGIQGNIEDPDMEKINYEKKKDKELSKKYV